jgi:hypothetical protein
VPCRFSWNLALFGVGASLKSHGSNLWLSSNKIALFHWTLDPHLKWLLRRLTQKGKATNVVQHGPLKSNILIMFSYWLYSFFFFNTFTLLNISLPIVRKSIWRAILLGPAESPVNMHLKLRTQNR